MLWVHGVMPLIHLESSFSSTRSTDAFIEETMLLEARKHNSSGTVHIVAQLQSALVGLCMAVYVCTPGAFGAQRLSESQGAESLCIEDTAQRGL